MARGTAMCTSWSAVAREASGHLDLASLDEEGSPGAARNARKEEQRQGANDG